MKRLRKLVGASFVLGFVSAFALLAEYLALCDIAKAPTPVTEWYVVGICMMVMAAFVICALITLAFVLSQPQLSSEIPGTQAK
jgi:hypothetical protein